MVLLAFYAPGQATKERPNIASLKKGSLGSIIERLEYTTRGVLGSQLTERIISATPKEMASDTQLSQTTSYFDTMAMALSFIYGSTGLRDNPLIERLADGSLDMAVSGDSCGGITASFLPGPTECLEKQLVRYAQGAIIINERGKSVALTEHRKGYGGLALMLNLNLETTLTLVDNTNRHLKHTNPRYKDEPQARYVKSNTPTVHGVAATNEALNHLNILAAEKGGRIYGPISNYFFHHEEVMNKASKSFHDFLKGYQIMVPAYHYISNRTAETPPRHYARRIRNFLMNDWTQGVMQPVRFYTGDHCSVVAASKELGVKHAIVINDEIDNWLEGSGIEPHLMKDLSSLRVVKQEVLSILAREEQRVPRGVRQPARQSRGMAVTSPAT